MTKDYLQRTLIEQAGQVLLSIATLRKRGEYAQAKEESVKAIRHFLHLNLGLLLLCPIEQLAEAEEVLQGEKRQIAVHLLQELILIEEARSHFSIVLRIKEILQSFIISDGKPSHSRLR